MLTATGARRVLSSLPAWLALADRDGEIDGPGYHRQPVGPWTAVKDGTYVAPEVTFGPCRYGRWATAAQVVLVDLSGWEPVVIEQLNEPFTAINGDTLKLTPHLVLTGDN